MMVEVMNERSGLGRAARGGRPQASALSGHFDRGRSLACQQPPPAPCHHRLPINIMTISSLSNLPTAFRIRLVPHTSTPYIQHLSMSYTPNVSNSHSRHNHSSPLSWLAAIAFDSQYDRLFPVASVFPERPDRSYSSSSSEIPSPSLRG